MSKSLKRVKAYLDGAGLDVDILHLEANTKTAAMAADVMGCHVNQIVKSVILLGESTGKALLFLTAGGHRVDVERAGDQAGEQLLKADAALIRQQTGFAIGGVSPFGHLSPIRAFIDPVLFQYDDLWAAAGTPHHLFKIAPGILQHHTKAKLAHAGVMVTL